MPAKNKEFNSLFRPRSLNGNGQVRKREGEYTAIGGKFDADEVCGFNRKVVQSTFDIDLSKSGQNIVQVPVHLIAGILPKGQKVEQISFTPLSGPTAIGLRSQQNAKSVTQDVAGQNTYVHDLTKKNTRLFFVVDTPNKRVKPTYEGFFTVYSQKGSSYLVDYELNLVNYDHPGSKFRAKKIKSATVNLNRPLDHFPKGLQALTKNI